MNWWKMEYDDKFQTAHGPSGHGKAEYQRYKVSLIPTHVWSGPEQLTNPEGLRLGSRRQL